MQLPLPSRDNTKPKNAIHVIARSGVKIIQDIANDITEGVDDATRDAADKVSIFHVDWSSVAIGMSIMGIVLIGILACWTHRSCKKRKETKKEKPKSVQLPV
ncbi:hypothetical protein MKZ38_001649 [Zalerion maritima]|uniref:Transmembrane protein n=1 Tax=Zalerion maritima TaxID=339359 RepID=A0AAD5REV9_9PEZI|nr:hypothetical protein MKZ38_001649 [Zalerion maritima]